MTRGADGTAVTQVPTRRPGSADNSTFVRGEAGLEAGGTSSSVTPASPIPPVACRGDPRAQSCGYSCGSARVVLTASSGDSGASHSTPGGRDNDRDPGPA